MEDFPDWYPIPPSTGPTWPTWPDDEYGRQSAIDFGQRHADVLEALERLANENGGGLSGAIKGALDEYERRQLITARDKERLIAVLDEYKSGTAIDADQEASIRRIQQLFDEGVADPTSKPAALAVLSVAANNAAAAVTESAEGNAFITGYVDGVAAALTVALGFAPMYAAASAASYVARHTRVSVSWH